MRVMLKRFIMIPINTADHTLILIAGDLKQQIATSIEQIRKRLNEHMHPPPPGTARIS